MKMELMNLMKWVRCVRLLYIYKKRMMLKKKKKRGGVCGLFFRGEEIGW